MVMKVQASTHILLQERNRFLNLNDSERFDQLEEIMVKA